MGDRGRFQRSVARRVLGATAAAALGLTGVASLVACDNGSDPKPGTLTPMPTTSRPASTTVAPATTVPTGDPTPTTSITLYDEHDATIDSFVQEFFAAYNAAQDSRDLSTFEAMYLPQCEGCIAMRDELAGWLAEGDAIDGGDWHIMQQNSDSLPDGSSGDFTVVAYRDGASVTSGGSVVETVKPTGVQLVLGSVVSDNKWRGETLAFRADPT